MSISTAHVELAPQTAAAFELCRGSKLRIVDPYGEQVADLALFRAANIRECFSPGRTIDYAESVRVRVGSVLYSQGSSALARVIEDTVGVHDVLLAPCSAEMFERRGQLAHPSCHQNLSAALVSFGVLPDMMTATINIFMDVRIAPDGAVSIAAPASDAGDVFAIEALDNLIVGIAACSSELTNNGRCKPIRYEIRSSASK